MKPVALRDFRDDCYACLYRRADALFALAEALLTAGAVPSPGHRWGALDTAVPAGGW